MDENNTNLDTLMIDTREEVEGLNGPWKLVWAVLIYLFAIGLMPATAAITVTTIAFIIGIMGAIFYYNKVERLPAIFKKEFWRGSPEPPRVTGPDDDPEFWRKTL